MKIVVLTLLTIVVAALAVPVEVDSNDDAKLTLVDLENEQPIAADESAPEAPRSKRFIKKKILLAKAGLLGVG